MMKLGTTTRGFTYYKFKDRYNATCSLQKSSLATEDAVWLGVDFDPDGRQINHGRMHLTKDQVNQLLPILQQFVLTGEINPERKDNE